jgi:hypothetical protein
MQSGAGRSSFNYAVFTFGVDDAGAVNIPIGVALWSSERRSVAVRLVQPNEHLMRFHVQEHYPFVDVVREKIAQWMQKGRLPYAEQACEPHDTAWWSHARQLLIHRIRLSEPRPVDCADPEQELEPLYEAIVSPYRGAKESRARVDGEIRKCLDGLANKFRSRQELAGYGGRRVRVMQSFDGPTGTVVIEGVNLASPQAEIQSDAVVSRLLRLRAGTKKRLEVLVGYLASPEGLNGEKVLVDWIEHETQAKTFDLVKQRQQLQHAAGDLVAQASLALSHQVPDE